MAGSSVRHFLNYQMANSAIPQQGPFQTLRALYTKIDDEHPRAIPDGVEELSFVVETDFKKLEYMAQLAAANKSSKSVDGPITVRIIARRKI